jgi:protein-tyrosine phosphatase/membrane-associated phospholipid phosphatase
MKFLPALRASVQLSLLFMLVYCGTNWLTSLRHDVGTMVFDWESHIPFLPWFIVPYMSIDLFFVAAPFLCANTDELRIFTRRVILATCIAGACFLLFPLKFSFERPATDGWLGVVFDSFRELDRPFNQLPSLHITLMMILAATCARHTRGLTRAVLMTWFTLIGASTVFTWQHHVVDVAGGFLLGALCFYLAPDTRVTERSNPNRRVGWYYASAAVVSMACALVLLPWGVFLIWPAGALAMCSHAYLRTGAGTFGKVHGQIPWCTRVWMAPVLLGQQLSLLHYSRQCRPWDEICPGLWIGRLLRASEAQNAIQQGVTAVLDLTGEFSETPALLQCHYLNIPVLDLTAPTPDQFARAIAFIDHQISIGTVYIHCKIGYSRSAAVTMAWLVHSGRAVTIQQAENIVRAARPSVVVRPEIIPALKEFLGTRSLKSGDP